MQKRTKDAKAAFDSVGPPDFLHCTFVCRDLYFVHRNHLYCQTLAVQMNIELRLLTFLTEKFIFVFFFLKKIECDDSSFDRSFI